MIETININDREVELCINAGSVTLPEEGSRRLFISRQLSAVKKKYHLESEGFMFFDESKAISIAAQVVQWIHADIQPGRHFIILPCDNVVYVATIQVHENYILVEKEDLLSFEDSMQLIRRNPLNCQVAELGKLSHAFAQNNIELRDLHINLDPGKNNPFLLKRGYRVSELLSLGIAPVIVAWSVILLVSTIDVEEIKETTTQTLSKPQASARIDTDLNAIDALLAAFAVLLAYNLEDIQVQKTPKGYNATATGRYDQAFSLARLNEIARQLEGRLSVQKNNWTLNSSLFKPPAGETEELLPLRVSFERYRRFARAVDARFSIIGISQKQRSALGVIELSMPQPNPYTLRQAVQLLQETNLHGYLQKARINTRPHAAWQNLTMTIEITGT